MQAMVSMPFALSSADFSGKSCNCSSVGRKRKREMERKGEEILRLFSHNLERGGIYIKKLRKKGSAKIRKNGGMAALLGYWVELAVVGVGYDWRTDLEAMQAQYGHGAP
ncbi:hypothetical protein ACFX2J_032125 [Malus domestica]